MDGKYIDKLKFWCNKILPLVYDDTLSYYELLCKVTSKINEVIEKTNEISGDFREAITAWLATEEGEQVIAEILTDLIDEQYSNLVTRVDALEETTEGLPANVNALNTSVANLNKKIIRPNGVNLNGGNIVFFGDSWTVGGSAGSTEKRFSAITSRALGMTEYNYGVGGAGFAIPNKILTGVNNADNNMSASQKENTTIVVITGGVNDSRNWTVHDVTVSKFYEGVNEVVERAHNVFPNALICLAIGNTIQYGSTNSYKYAVMYANRYIGNKTYPILILDNVLNWVSNTGWYATESAYPVPIHLNEIGHRIFANYLTNGILGGGSSVYQFLQAIPWDPTYIQSQVGVAHLWRYNERLCITNVQVRFVGEYSGNHTVANLPSYCAPQTNIYAPIYRENVIVGTMAITEGTSNLHIVAEQPVTSLYLPELSWRAY